MADDKTREAIERVQELSAELEAYADVVEDAALAEARATLSAWVAGLKAIVVNPALGRVTVIDAEGREATIVSPHLPYALSKPVGPRKS